MKTIEVGAVQAELTPAAEVVTAKTRAKMVGLKCGSTGKFVFDDEPTAEHDVAELAGLVAQTLPGVEEAASPASGVTGPNGSADSEGVAA